MVTYRQQKKIAYAAGFFLFLLLVISLPVFLNLNSETAAPSAPISNYQPLTIEQVDVIPQARGTDVVAHLKNSNPQAGVAELKVRFTALNDQDQAIASQTVATYLTPGSLQYVIALNLPVRDFAKIDVQIPEPPVFTEIPAAVQMPDFSIFLRERTTRPIGNLATEEQKGVIRNISSLDWQRVELTSLALDSSGRTIAAAQTFVGELKTGEQREFTLQWPAPPAPTAQVIVVANTNIYREENIVKILGDPALLR